MNDTLAVGAIQRVRHLRHHLRNRVKVAAAGRQRRRTVAHRRRCAAARLLAGEALDQALGQRGRVSRCDRRRSHVHGRFVPRWRHGSGWRLTQLGDNRAQRGSLDELHRVVVRPVLLPSGVDGHDIGVMELRGGFGFTPKPNHRLRTQAQGAGKHLQRHLAVQRNLPRLVDNSHPPATQFADDFEIAEAFRSGCGRLAHDLAYRNCCASYVLG